MALKLDLNKAYDCVEWDFLETMLQCMSFPPHFIILLLLCIRSVSFLVLLNSIPSHHFYPSLGIRQGDSLSPLFVP